MDILFTHLFDFKHYIRVALKSADLAKSLYRSGLTPTPGPGGGSVRQVSPPAGSQEKRPFLKGGKDIFFHHKSCT